MANPKPTAKQVRAIRAKRAAAMKRMQNRIATGATPNVIAETREEIRMLDAWLYAYVTGPNAAKGA